MGEENNTVTPKEYNSSYRTLFERY